MLSVATIAQRVMLVVVHHSHGDDVVGRFAAFGIAVYPFTPQALRACLAVHPLILIAEPTQALAVALVVFWIASVERPPAVQAVLSKPVCRAWLVFRVLIVVAVDAHAFGVMYAILLASLAPYPSPDLDSPL